MATATSRDNHQAQQLLPSPPPSPPSTRRRRKKKSDPFEELPITPIPSPPSSPPNELAEEEPLLTKIILTPLYFISFIFSLFIVNYRDRARRTKSHSSHSFLSYLYPSTWLDPEPYQDPDDSTWGRSSSAGHVEPNDAIGPRKDKGSAGGKKKKKTPWHLNKKIRKIARLEISDALEMRGTILAGICAALGLGLIALWMGMRWLLTSLSASLSSTNATRA
ncbi:Nn.00g098720.m01.CDS01 [Neocucurbitaria sp. VM-36]